MNQLAGPARAEALRHIMACERCRIIHRGLRALEEGARAAGLGPPLPASSATRSWIMVGGVLAAVAAVLLVWWRVGSGAGPARPTLRGERAVIIVQASAQMRAGGELRWTGVPDAIRYRVAIFGPDGAPAWQGETAPPSPTAMAWPEEVTAPGTYRWRVEALDARGQIVARSLLTPVELVR